MRSLSVSSAIALTALVSLVLHVAAGWALTVLAGVLGGWLCSSRGVLVGISGVTAAWILLVAWNLAVAPGPIAELFWVLGELFGGLPSAAIPAITVVIGGVLGGAGGWAGSSVRNLIDTPRR